MTCLKPGSDVHHCIGPLIPECLSKGQADLRRDVLGWGGPESGWESVSIPCFHSPKAELRQAVAYGRPQQAEQDYCIWLSFRVLCSQLDLDNTYWQVTDSSVVLEVLGSSGCSVHLPVYSDSLQSQHCSYSVHQVGEGGHPVYLVSQCTGAHVA